MTTVAAADPSTPSALGAQARELLERDRWSREQLDAYQRERLRLLIRHAIERSPYYREALGPGAEHADLADLPTLPKQRLMEQFDRIVTDPRLRLAGLEPFLAAADAGALYLGEYRVYSTSGTSGVPGLFVYSQEEFAYWTAVMLRSFVRLGMTPETRLIGVGAPSALQISQQSIAVLQAAGRSGAPRLSVTTPLDEVVAALNQYQPEMLGGYASVIALLADEQLQGRLTISPRLVLTSSELLTEDAAARITAAWTKPIQGYFSTEVLVIASDSPDRVGMHVCEEAIVEVLDEANRPVPPGTLGSKVLLTNLVNFTQPLIRYELLDAVEPRPGRTRAGGRTTESRASKGAATTCSGCRPWAEACLRSTPTGCASRSCGSSTCSRARSVHRDDGLVVRIVVRGGASRDVPERVREPVEAALADAGAAVPLAVEVVDAIQRAPGHAAKVKLVVSEVGRAP